MEEKLTHAAKNKTHTTPNCDKKLETTTSLYTKSHKNKIQPDSLNY